MNSYNQTIFIIVLISFTEARHQTTLKSSEARFYPATRNEYDNSIHITEDLNYLSKELLINNGLANIKSFPLGITYGILPSFFANLRNQNTAEESDKDYKVSFDAESEYKEDAPLCVIAIEESTVNDDLSGRTESKQKNTPNCIVLEKNREGENTPNHSSRNEHMEMSSNNMFTYPTAIPFSNVVPFVAWIDSGSSAAPPFYYPPYPFAYPQSIQNAKRFTNSKINYWYKSKIQGTRFARDFKMLTPQSSQLTREITQSPEQLIFRSREDKQMFNKDQQHSDSTNIQNNTPQNAIVQTQEMHKFAYHPVLYPQFGYQSHYPKVTYAHALPYPAPVYIPSSPTSIIKNNH